MTENPIVTHVRLGIVLETNEARRTICYPANKTKFSPDRLVESPDSSHEYFAPYCHLIRKWHSVCYLRSTHAVHGGPGGILGDLFRAKQWVRVSQKVFVQVSKKTPA